MVKNKTLNKSKILVNNGKPKKTNTVQHEATDTSCNDIRDYVNNFADEFIKSRESQIDSASKQNFVKSQTKSELVYFGKIEDELPTSIDVTGIDLEGYISTKTDLTAREGRNKILNLYNNSLFDEKVWSKSVLTPDFEAKHSVPVKLSRKALKQQRRDQRTATAGDDWYHMKPPELTDELKKDFEILQMRSVLDPKRFYKNPDREDLPKYFQVGKVMDNAADFYSSRLKKKERKQTLADELLADAKFQHYRKKRMADLAMKRQSLVGKMSRIKKSRKSKT